jgi:hypothetical protein
MWDVHTMKEVGALALTNLGPITDACAGELSAWAISPDGKTAALTWSIALVKGRKFMPPPLVLAEAGTGKVLAWFEPPAAASVGAHIEDPNTFDQRVPASCFFTNVAWSADGGLLAAADGAGTVRVWEKADKLTDDRKAIQGMWPGRKYEIVADATQPAGSPILLKLILTNSGKEPLPYVIPLGSGNYPPVNLEAKVTDDAGPHFFLKIALGIMPCTPSVPSTTWVTQKSTAMLVTI